MNALKEINKKLIYGIFGTSSFNALFFIESYKDF